jgi:hypothetical protein
VDRDDRCEPEVASGRSDEASEPKEYGWSGYDATERYARAVLLGFERDGVPSRSWARRSSDCAQRLGIAATDPLPEWDDACVAGPRLSLRSASLEAFPLAHGRAGAK